MRTTVSRPPRTSGRIVLGLLAVAVLLAPRGAEAQLKEYEVKAAFLLSFAKFVEWPEGSFSSPGDPIVIALAGEDPFGGALERVIEGRTAQGRTFAIKHFRRTDRVGRCHALFIAGSEDADEWLDALGRRQAVGVLTVGEGRDFRRRGAISFLVEQRRLKLAVNLDEVADARLQISSKLLALAQIVSRRRDSAKQ